MSYIFYDYDHYIYCLKDPFNDEAFYIGRTINPQNRLLQHFKYSKNAALKLKIDEIIAKNSKPIMEILDKCKKQFASEKEMFWIMEFSKNNTLLNRRVGRTPSIFKQGHQGLNNDYYRNFSNIV